MPHPRVKLEIWHPDEATLTAAVTTLKREFPNANRIFDTPYNWTRARIPGEGSYVVCADVRLKASADAQALFDALKTQAATLRTQGFKGRIHYHQCTHEDAVVLPCVDGVFEVL